MLIDGKCEEFLEVIQYNETIKRVQDERINEFKQILTVCTDFR